VPLVNDVIRLIRLDAHTGALDPSFGLGGRRALRGWANAWDPRSSFGVLRDGRAVIGFTSGQHSETGQTSLHYFYALP
jgi:hypothetical protein